jgi:hypothetical protein
MRVLSANVSSRQGKAGFVVGNGFIFAGDFAQLSAARR